MNDEMKDLDFNLALLPYVAELVAQNGILDSIRELRLNALKSLASSLSYYKSLNYMDKLLYP